jgi:magnesium chelatase subunit ChlD-like protein
MRQRGRRALAKGYAMRLIEQAARAGDRVAVLSFGGDGIQLLLPPRAARAAAGTHVQHLGGGGGTPLAACLREAERLLRQEQPGDSWLWLLTDGRTLEQPPTPTARHVVIVDFEATHRPTDRSIGRCALWARQWGAEHLHPPKP